MLQGRVELMRPRSQSLGLHLVRQMVLSWDRHSRAVTKGPAAWTESGMRQISTQGPALICRNYHSKGNTHRTKKKKAPPSFKGSLLHPSHQGCDAFRSFWVTFPGVQQQERASAALWKHRAHLPHWPCSSSAGLGAKVQALSTAQAECRPVTAQQGWASGIGF